VLRQARELNCVPGYFPPRLVVNSLVNAFVGPTSQLLIESLEAVFGRLLTDLVVFNEGVLIIVVVVVLVKLVQILGLLIYN
jgi:hypothetical protein